MYFPLIVITSNKYVSISLNSKINSNCGIFVVVSLIYYGTKFIFSDLTVPSLLIESYLPYNIIFMLPVETIVLFYIYTSNFSVCVIKYLYVVYSYGSNYSAI